MSRAPARFRIRVKPNSKGGGVGGTWGERGPLNVAVAEPAAYGKANDAALGLLATVLGVRRRQLSIVHGETHRTKLVEVTDPPDDLDQRLARWREGAS